MRIRHYLDAIRKLDDVAVELLWRLREEQSASTQAPSWRLPEDLASELVISWPANYNWGSTERWMYHFLAGFRNIVRVERTNVPDNLLLEGCIVILFSYRDCTYRIAIDYSDYMDQISQPALSGATRYFKMQYRRGGYGDDRIIPGGYPVGSPHSYQYLAKLRNECDAKPRHYNVYGRFGLRYSAELRRKAMAL
jgi:hypothetical protein